MKLTLLVVVSVYLCSFVVCNEKLSSNSKGGFFVTYFIAIALGLLLNAIMR